MVFSPDARSSEESTSPGLSVSEYVAIGISSVLLGLIYVASVFLYLHIRKRRAKSVSQSSEDIAKVTKSNLLSRRESQPEKERRVSTIPNNENVIIKSNPLLGISRHFHEREKLEQEEFSTDSEDCQTDGEENVDGIMNEEDVHQKQSVSIFLLIQNFDGPQKKLLNFLLNK